MKTMQQKLDAALEAIKSWTPRQRAEALLAAGIVKEKELELIIKRLEKNENNKN